jgi:peptide/nickel transport system permease protein
MSISLKIYAFIKIFKSLFKYRRFRIGLAIITIIAILSIASLFSPPQYKQWYAYPKDRPPQLTSIDMILGTTTNGRPVFWIMVNALANSLYIGLLTALIGSHAGLLVGLLAGLSRGKTESAFILLIDSFIVMPGLPILIVLALALKQSMTILTIPLILSIIAWAWPARNVRSITLSVISKDFITIASFSGIKFFNILLHEIMPYVLGWHLTNFINTIIWAIGMETALAVFGLSILSEDTLGTMIYWVLNYNALFRGMWWWLLPPIILLISIFVGFYLISVSVSSYLNPRLRGGGQQ